MSETGVSLDACGMTGTFFHNVDAKGRINFPSKLRELIGETFWISRGTSAKFLSVYSREGWIKVMEQINQYTGRQGEMIRRRLCGGAVEVTPDKQGRILIPAALREFAGLDKDVVVLGAGIKAEIWDYDRWKENDDSFDPDDLPLLEELCL